MDGVPRNGGRTEQEKARREGGTKGGRIERGCKKSREEMRGAEEERTREGEVITCMMYVSRML